MFSLIPTKRTKRSPNRPRRSPARRLGFDALEPRLLLSHRCPPHCPTTPSLSINDVSAAEGDIGQKAFNFTVTRSGDTAPQVTVDFATGDGTAKLADNDYVSNSGALTFLAGETTKTITVLVNGDTKLEPNETFLVNLSNAAGGSIADGQGVGTILNDEPPPYDVLDLGSLDHTFLFHSTANDLNDKADVEVVGVSWVEGVGQMMEHAFFWTATTGLVDLNRDDLGANWSAANGINNRGEIVGESALNAGGPGVVDDAAYWRVEVQAATGTATVVQALLLPRPAGHGAVCCREAEHINSAGQIAGWSVRDDGVRQGVLWELGYDVAGNVTGVTTTNLGDFVPYDHGAISNPLDANRNGVIDETGVMAGYQVSTNLAAVAYIDAAGLHVFSLGKRAAVNTWSRGNDINNVGQVVGNSSGGYLVIPDFTVPAPWTNELNPWFVDADGDEDNDRMGVHDLTSFSAFGINDPRAPGGLPQVVGGRTLWADLNGDGVGELYDLNQLTNTPNYSAIAINNKVYDPAIAQIQTGQIVGRSPSKDGISHAFLVTPKPFGPPATPFKVI